MRPNPNNSFPNIIHPFRNIFSVEERPDGFVILDAVSAESGEGFEVGPGCESCCVFCGGCGSGSKRNGGGRIRSGTGGVGVGHQYGFAQEVGLACLSMSTSKVDLVSTTLLNQYFFADVTHLGCLQTRYRRERQKSQSSEERSFQESNQSGQCGSTSTRLGEWVFQKCLFFADLTHLGCL